MTRERICCVLLAAAVVAFLPSAGVSARPFQFDISAGALKDLLQSLDNDPLRYHGFWQLPHVAPGIPEPEPLRRMQPAELAAWLKLTVVDGLDPGDEVEVRWDDGTRLAAYVHAAQPGYDLALLRLDSDRRDWPALGVSALPTSKLELREVVMAGYPRMTRLSLRVGHVSGRGRLPSPQR